MTTRPNINVPFSCTRTSLRWGDIMRLTVLACIPLPFLAWRSSRITLMGLKVRKFVKKDSIYLWRKTWDFNFVYLVICFLTINYINWYNKFWKKKVLYYFNFSKVYCVVTINLEASSMLTITPPALLALRVLRLNLQYVKNVFKYNTLRMEVFVTNEID